LLCLKRMKGFCFNGLVRDHNVAFCNILTRCWRWRQSDHISIECRSSGPKQSSSSLPDNSPGSAPTHTHDSRGTDTVDGSLLQIMHNSSITVSERLTDLMLLEALLINQKSNARGNSSPPSSTAMSQHAINIYIPAEEIQTPMLIRSEAEQLVGHDLIKPLANFNQMGSPSLKLNEKTKNKSWTSCFKVVLNMLMKKWGFIKKNN
jgi:hypothetical protein